MAVASAVELPVIDISQATPEAGKEMLNAAIEYGFLYVDSTSTEFSKKTVDEMFDLSRRFFKETPFAVKDRFRIGGNNRGWSGMHSETLDPEHQERGDFKEAMNFGEFKDGKPQQPVPDTLIPHESQIAKYHELCRTTCARILEILALGLGIPQDWFTTRHDPATGPTGSIFRMLYYPNVDDPTTSTYRHGVDIRAGAHSDYGSITLLFQRDGQPGLQIQTPENTWAPVPVRPPLSSAKGNTAILDQQLTSPPILVNIGDLLSYWTAGLLKSTVHRVIFPCDAAGDDGADEKAQRLQKADRYSIAYFCHPNDETELVPVPSQLVERRKRENEARGVKEASTGGFVPTKAKEHLASRLAATYGGGIEKYL